MCGLFLAGVVRFGQQMGAAMIARRVVVGRFARGEIGDGYSCGCSV